MSTAETAVNHARELHADAIVITSHDHRFELADLLQMKEGGLDAKVSMLQVDVLAWDEEGLDSSLRSIYSYEGWARRALVKIERMLRIVEAHADRFLLVRRAGDILEAHRNGRAGIIFGFEGTRPLEGELELLGIYHRLGLRHLQLTWAFGSQVCDRFLPPPGELSWSNFYGKRLAGLTDFGRAVIAEADRLGIVLDPGHCSEQVFYGLLDLTSHPIVISHGSCRDAGKNAGDLSDAQLGALAQNGGVACMHFFANYVRDRNATIDDLIDHILHVAQVAGIDHVGLGPDWLPLTPEFVRVNGQFAGFPSDYVRPPDQPLGPVAELNKIRKLPRLTERMVERGLADEDIRKVLGGNLLRVYRDVWN